MNHPWMTKGFNSPPENFLPHREPLQLPLDPAVVQKMTGFDFGSPDYITAQLTKVIDSDDYQRAVRLAARKHATQTPEADRKRDIFTFYKRRNSTTSRDTLTNPSSEQIPVGQDPLNGFSPLISIYFLVREKMEREAQEANPGALAMPKTTGEKPIKMPDLTAPEAAYTNPQTYEMAGEAPTGGRSRPRARTHGEDEVTDGLQKINLRPGDTVPTPQIIGPGQDQTPKKESVGAGLLRRFSTRRRREPELNPPPAVSVFSPADAVGQPPKKSFSVRRSRGDKQVPSTASLQVDGSQRFQPELLTPPSAGNDSFPKRFMSLRRSTSVDRRRLGKRGASEGAHLEPPATSGSDGSSLAGRGHRPTDTASGDLQMRPNAPAARAKSLGHARRESIQQRRLRREQQRESNVPEETDADLAEETHDERTDDVMKPIYLKGLFSVSTTSSKPLPVIRADIIRVLKQLGVDYSEIKGGFSCRHAPSILEKENQKLSADDSLGTSLTPIASEKHRRRISLGGLIGTERERDDVREKSRAEPLPTSAPAVPTTPRTPRRPPVGAQDYSHSQTATDIDSSESESHHNRVRKPNPHKRTLNPGETSTHVRDDVGESMTLRFEIVIVKVPLLSLHGIQFKKVDGNMMHYKNMAQEILKALRL